MKATVFIAYILLLMDFVVGVAFIYLFVLLVRALRKYIKSEPVRKEIVVTFLIIEVQCEFIIKNQKFF